jgi:hypothetical protein
VASADDGTKVAARAVTVETLFGSFYEIPDFQREYIWKPRQVKTLLSDLQTSWSTGNATEYFLGSIVLTVDKKQELVVDGQQRLTTLFVLLAVLRERCVALNGDEETLEILSRALRDVSMSKGKASKKLRIRHNLPEMNTTLETIGEGNGRKLKKRTTQDVDYNLVNAYSLIYDFIAAEFGTDVDTLVEFFSFLWQEVELIRVRAASMQQAFVIFETINFRGVTLDAMDLMKNLLFKEVDSSHREALQDAWRAMLGALRNGGENRPVRFLRYYLLTQHSFESMPTTADLFGLIASDAVALSLGYRKDPVKFVNKMVEAAKVYANIHRGLAPDGSPNAHVDGIRQQRSGVKQHLCLLLAARHMPAINFTLFASRLEALTLVFAVTGVQWNSLETKLPEWAPKIAKLRTKAQVQWFITKSVEPLIDKASDGFWEKLDRTDTMKPRLLRYLLASTTRYVEIENKKDIDLAELLKSSVTIEHIFSQKPIEAAVKEFGVPAGADRNDYVYAVGNLMLLSRPLNSSVKNAPYSKKVKEYRKGSTYDLSRSVFMDIKFGGQTKKNMTSWGFEHNSKWTPAEHGKRHTAMKALVAHIWGVPGG